MRNSQRSWPVLLLLVLGLLLVGARVSYAQGELTYLALQREGQASVAIDVKKKAGYVIDLGRAGDGDQVMLEDLPLLDRLEQLGIEELFFVCSHPHSDHMGGIKALFRRPRVFFKDGQLTAPRFKSVSVIDDGVSDSLYLELQRSLPKNALIKTRRISATNRNAFAGISTMADDVYIETIPYDVEAKPSPRRRAVSSSGKRGTSKTSLEAKSSPHGRAVITYIRLGQNQVTVDFDDADSEVILKAVNTLKARGEIKINAFVVPHHGSKYHDIEPILDLNPDHAIIAVNPENRYGHPSPTILQKLMEKLGKKNVVFTGSVHNVVLDGNGIKSAMFTAADRDSYAMFVAPNRLRAEKLGNVEDVQATIAIQRMMEDDGGGSASGGASARTLLEEEVKLNGSILRPEFEFGAVSYARDGMAALQGTKIFAYPLGPSEDLTDQDVAVVLERPISTKDDVPDKLSQPEALSIIQRLKLLGTNAEKARNIHVYFSSPTGLRDVLEPALLTQPRELAALSVGRTLASPDTTGPRPGTGGRRTRPRRTGPSNTRPPRPQAAPSWESLPRGGMVFLQGGKLFPAGEANELIGGILDMCGTNYCVRTSVGDAYTLPFSPGPLFSEVWTRVYERRIDSFYLSINPTKQFLQNIDSGLERIPSDRLRFGTGQPGAGIRTHEVVTAGDIKGTKIGQILWEADVAFKSKSLGYNVLTGDRDSFFGASHGLTQQESGAETPQLNVPYRQRWCRLYWTSGAQTIEIGKPSGRIGFKGDAVVARSEPMVMRNGDLVDEPRGTWCDESKSVAAYLQEQTNAGGGPEVLQQLRELAEIQSFVRWARDNGITPADAFLQSIDRRDSASGDEVPTWTSGIKSDPRIEIRQQGSLTGGSPSNILHISAVDLSGLMNCVRPYWAQLENDFLANDLHVGADGVWDIPSGKYPFVDEWMGTLARKIALCSGGELLSPFSAGRRERVIGAPQRRAVFGIKFNLHAIHMHGGVLLGAQQGFLESAWKDKGLLLSLNRRPLFQREGGKLHFWNYSDNHPRFGTLGQHVVIDDGEVTGAYAEEGHLVFTVTARPGAIALQESRWGRADHFTNGLEWAGARHGSDGSWIWEKAAWPCVGSGGAGVGCVQVSQTALDELWTKIGGEKSSDPAIRLTQVGENTWRVDLNISSLRSELDGRWRAVPSSDLNSRLSLIYEYAKWGFVNEAYQKCLEVADKIEGDTVDTILLNLIKLSRQSN